MAIDRSNSNCGTAPRLRGGKRVFRARQRHFSTQPRWCTLRDNRESARTGNIAIPGYRSITGPNSCSFATGRCAAQQVLNWPRDRTRQSARQGSSRTRRREVASGLGSMSPLGPAGSPRPSQAPGFCRPRQLAVSLRYLRDRYLPIVCAGPLRLKLEPGMEGRALTDGLARARSFAKTHRVKEGPPAR